MAAHRLILDDTAMEWLLNSPDGPVGEYIIEKGRQAAVIAQAAAPIMKQKNYGNWGKRYNPEYQYGPPGHTKANTHFATGFTRAKHTIWAGVNAPAGPTIYLEYPAEQIHSMEYAFLSFAFARWAV